ncbi:MAG: methyltransferase domain-containing protein [Planctomycetaceae bacterium]|nr:methyltransferase domain-containing protein [Planctomycetaceae bacterium]
MKTNSRIHLTDVQAVYNGPEGKLWELIMGEQIHIGGFASSMDLAEKAGIRGQGRGVDLCCCNGAGMRFLVQFCGVGSMMGVDATQTVLQQCHVRCQQAGLDGRITCLQSDVCRTGLPERSFDFAWGEDAWCYVEDKSALIKEAARIVKPRGTIAFTDWLEGPTPMNKQESKRLLEFMKFPSILTVQDYRRLLESSDCEVLWAEDTGRFAPCVDLYLEMVGKQHTYDALKIIGFDMKMLEAISGEMAFMHKLAHERKIIQGLFVGRKN